MDPNKFRICCISFAFIVVISFPLINGKAHLVKDIKSFENRAMAKEPEFDAAHLDPFPAKYEKFYIDHFDLRNRLIRYFNVYNVRTFRKSPIPSVVIGKDGWLFLAGEEMDSYTGRNRLSPSELEAFKAELEYRQDYLGKKGIRFYFMIIPCKASIYPEKIGYEFFRIHNDSWGEQLNTYLASHSSIKPINVFDSLRNHREELNLYYKLDNHWNDLGAFYTANEVFKRLHKDFPAVVPLSRGNFRINDTGNPSSNLQNMLGNLSEFSERAVELIPEHGFAASVADKAGYPPVEGFAYPWEYEEVRAIQDSGKPRLLIISDSFGKNIFPFLSENFSKTVKIFDSWQYKLNADIVAQEKPDAVLLMINEPILRNLLNFQSRLQHN